MMRVLKYNVDKRINFQRMVDSANMLNADCFLECVGRTKGFLWIPARKKYILTVRFTDQRQLLVLQSYIAGALS